MQDENKEKNISSLDENIAAAHKAVSQPNLSVSSLAMMADSWKSLKASIHQGVYPEYTDNHIKAIETIISIAEGKILHSMALHTIRDVPNADALISEHGKHVWKELRMKSLYTLSDYFIADKRKLGEKVVKYLNRELPEIKPKSIGVMLDVFAEMGFVDDVYTFTVPSLETLNEVLVRTFLSYQKISRQAFETHWNKYQNKKSKGSTDLKEEQSFRKMITNALNRKKNRCK